MTRIFAEIGERVVTEEGEYICRVAEPLATGGRVEPSSFCDWQIPEPAVGDILGKGFRKANIEASGRSSFYVTLAKACAGVEVCIEGEWRS